MESLPEEILIPPTPLVALVGDVAFLDMLALCLKSANSASSAPVRVRYEAAASSSGFAGKARTHAESDYAAYVPDGLLPSGWLEKHHNRVPAVVVRGAAAWGARRARPAAR